MVAVYLLGIVSLDAVRHAQFPHRQKLVRLRRGVEQCELPAVKGALPVSALPQAGGELVPGWSGAMKTGFRVWGLGFRV